LEQQVAPQQELPHKPLLLRLNPLNQQSQLLLASIIKAGILND